MLIEAWDFSNIAGLGVRYEINQYGHMYEVEVVMSDVDRSRHIILDRSECTTLNKARQHILLDLEEFN